MQTLFYDDRPLVPLLTDAEPSIFFAGPTSKSCRSRWRLDAVELLADREFAGTVVITEFRNWLFSEVATAHFASEACPVSGMRPVSYNILDWGDERHRASDTRPVLDAFCDRGRGDNCEIQLIL